jgi:hypothetical protein
LLFSTNDPDGKIGAASRPGLAGKIEIEAADDFFLTQHALISSASFTGLLPDRADIGDVVVEIYRIFPQDSDVGPTSGPPTFSTNKVPTRVNSPSDVALDSRDLGAGELSLTTQDLGAYSALNSVLNGINPKPNQTDLGEGPISGQEVRFNVDFTTPFDLPAGHYFFVPQVQVENGEFFWLSAPRPIVAPGTPFPLGVTDLQTWIRNAPLDPDWLRVGGDIVGNSAFNMTFSLSGDVVPEPAAWALMLAGFGLAGAALRRRRAVGAQA